MDPVESSENKLRDQLSTPLRSIIQFYLANTISNTAYFVAFGSKFIVDFLKYLEHVKSEGKTIVTEEQSIKFLNLQPLLLELFAGDFSAEQILEEAISIVSSAFRGIATDKKSYRAACDALVNTVVAHIEKERENAKVIAEAESFGINPLTQEEHNGLVRLVKILRKIGDLEDKKSDGHVRSLVSMPALRLMNNHPEIAKIFPFTLFEEVLADVYKAFSIGETGRYFLNITSFETFSIQAEALDADLEKFVTDLLSGEEVAAFPSMQVALNKYIDSLTALKDHPKAWRAFVDFIKFICLQSFADRSYSLVNGRTFHLGDWYWLFLSNKSRPKATLPSES